MDSKAILLVALLAACGGTSPTTDTGTVADDPSAPPLTPPRVALQAGTYKATPAGSANALTVIGPAMETTLITEGSGAFTLVLPNYDFVRGGLAVRPDGTLLVAGGLTLIRQDGTVPPVTLVGTSNGTTITGTVNGAAFSVSLTGIQNQAFTIAQMAGSYSSGTPGSPGTSNNIGLQLGIGFGADGSITGSAYAVQPDGTAKLVRHYFGTIVHDSFSSPNPNAFGIGFSYYDVATDLRPPGTSGLAYFTANGLVVMTANPYTGEQLTAVFAKNTL